MKILQANSGLLTNAEVLAVLRDRGCDKPVGGANRALVSEKILHQHLSEQSLLNVPDLQSFIDAVKPFDLTRSEILQLANLVPSSAVEIFLIVESCEERLSEERVEELLKLISQHLRDKRKLHSE